MSEQKPDDENTHDEENDSIGSFDTRYVIFGVAGLLVCVILLFCFENLVLRYFFGAGAMLSVLVMMKQKRSDKPQ